MKRKPSLISAAALLFMAGFPSAMTGAGLARDPGPAGDPGPCGEPLERPMKPREFGERYRYNQRKARKVARMLGRHPANPKRRA